MARSTPSFACGACGAVYPRWAGRCEACGAWNTLCPEVPLRQGPGGASGALKKGRTVMLSDLASEEMPPARTLSGIAEFDRVLGGGLVAASATLVGGDPGIGKSTLLLQATAWFSRHVQGVLYISGEEATAQVRLRAQRLGLGGASVRLACETSLRDILTTLETERPALVVIDSIQTMWIDTIDSAPGSVGQVRACVHDLTSFAKRFGTAVILVGHVTKEGQIAGPRTVEHMVDTVLYLEGERSHQFRLLRAVKNRFGPADEIGVFEMTGTGLAEVANPSALFLDGRDGLAPGSVVFAGIEGSRPVLVEVQALVAPCHHSQPRRAVVGWDGGRLNMVIAVLEARAGVSFQGLDVYLNIAGGLRVSEPAADLAVVCALLSAREDIALSPTTVVFGELSLSGTLRPVAQVESRLKEAEKLGFEVAIASAGCKFAARPETGKQTFGVRAIPDLAALVEQVFTDR